MKRNPTCAGPTPDCPVAGITEQITGLLVRPDRFNRPGADQVIKHLNRLANPHHQRLTKAGQVCSQFNQTPANECPVSGREIGCVDERWFDDVEREHRATGSGGA